MAKGEVFARCVPNTRLLVDLVVPNLPITKEARSTHAHFTTQINSKTIH